MYDAVRVVAKAMDDLASIEGFRVEPINCQQPQRFWQDGDKILSYIRRVRIELLHNKHMLRDDICRLNTPD